MGQVRERSLVSWHGAIVVGLAVMGGCIAATPEEQARENLDDSDLGFEQWVGTVYQEPETGIWIVDGDTPIVTERELREFFMNHVQPGALVVAQSGGVDSKWSNTQKSNLTYCVSTSFGTRHAAAVSAMSTATAAWEAAANLDFVHVSSQGSSCTASNTSVVFDVRPTSGQPYLARAFFPNQSRPSRNVYGEKRCGSGMFTIESIVNMPIRHKHLKLNQDKLDRARQLLGVKTEQETVETALDLLLAEEAILEAHRRTRAVGGFEDIFAKPRARRSTRRRS